MAVEEQALDVEEQALATQRRRVRKTMEAAAALKKARQQAKEMTTRVGMARSKLKETQGLQATLKALKSFTPKVLGHGSPRGGGAIHKTRGKEVLSRLLSKGAPLNARAKNDWVWFVETWNAKMAEEHGAEWFNLFAQQMQHLAESLAAGEADAVATCMASETKRVLHDVVVLQV